MNLHHWHAWDEDIRIVPGVDQLYKFSLPPDESKNSEHNGPGPYYKAQKMQKTMQETEEKW